MVENHHDHGYQADLHKQKDDIDKQFTEVKADIREIRQLLFRV